MVYRIDDQTAVASPPALPTDNVGNPGFFSGGNPGLAPATRVRFWWLNMVQQELESPVDAAGLALDKTNNTQLLQALRLLFSATFQTYSTPGGFSAVVPPGKTQCLALLWAGGAGGGGTYGPNSAGTGGGGGEFRIGIVAGLVAGQVIAGSVGAGGAGGSNASSPGNGGAGGNTSLGGYVTAIGGGGGTLANGGVQAATGTNGGTGGSGGQYSHNGTPGGSGVAITSSSLLGGAGGAAFFSSAPGPNVSSAGLAGIGPGGGGNGGSYGGPGGPGAAGLVWLIFI